MVVHGNAMVAHCNAMAIHGNNAMAMPPQCHGQPWAMPRTIMDIRGHAMAMSRSTMAMP